MFNGQEKSFHLSRKQKLKSINNKQSNDSDIRSITVNGLESVSRQKEIDDKLVELKARLVNKQGEVVFCSFCFLRKIPLTFCFSFSLSSEIQPSEVLFNLPWANQMAFTKMSIAEYSGKHQSLKTQGESSRPSP